MKEPIDIEEDDMATAWCVAPTEACTFVALAVFANKKDAETYARLLNVRKDAKGGYQDVVVLAASAYVHIANTHNVKAGRAALAAARKETP